MAIGAIASQFVTLGNPMGLIFYCRHLVAGVLTLFDPTVVKCSWLKPDGTEDAQLYLGSADRDSLLTRLSTGTFQAIYMSTAVGNWRVSPYWSHTSGGLTMPCAPYGYGQFIVSATPFGFVDTFLPVAPTVTFAALPAAVPSGTLAITGTATAGGWLLTSTSFGVTVNGVAQSATFTYSGGNWATTVSVSPTESVLIAVTATVAANGLSSTASRSTRVQGLSIITPSSGSPAVDEGPVVVTVAADPTVAGSTALQLYDGAATTGAAGTITAGATTAALVAGTHQITGRITVGGVEIASAARAVVVADQLPAPAFASPAQGARVSEGAVTVLMDVTHASAAPGQLVVEVSLDPTFATGVQTATWVSGVRWTASVTIAGQTLHTAYCRAHDSTVPAEWVSATPLVVNAMPAYVRFAATTGVYAPTVGLAPGSTATVTWTCEETSEAQTTLTPLFAISGTQHVRMSVSGDAFGDVRWVNHGFTSTDDRGEDSLSSAYDKAPDPLLGAEYLGNLTGMTYWFAARGNCSGVLDFSGCTALTHIEMFRDGSTDAAMGVTNLLLTGTSVSRICMERNRLSAEGEILDLNPVRLTLRDVRMAAQRDGILTLAVLTGSGWIVYHWCTNSQTVVNLPSPSVLTLCREWLTWNNGMRGAVVLNAACLQWDGNGDQPGAMGNRITSLDCSAVSSAIHTVRVQSNAMTTAAVDSMLAQLDAAGMATGHIDLRDTSEPSAAGLVSISNLLGRGVIDILYRTDEGTGIAVEPFDGVGTPASRGWAPFAWDGYVRQDTGAGLLCTSVGGAFSGYRAVGNPGDGVANATPNYEVELQIEAGAFTAGFDNYMGVLIRGKYNGDGVAVRWSNPTTCRIGNAYSPSDEVGTFTVVNALPASWTSGGATRTLLVRANGSTIDVYCDSVHYLTGTCTINQTAENSFFGIVGGGPATSRFPSITARALA